ncbi:MAG: DEAD/DEAH box helicase [Chlamydiia bacterium]|nr:DEAD/DEAH box helicase [Chlamydiia bacterium]
MINFRKLRQDYSPAILKEGKALFDKEMVVSAKIVSLDDETVRIAARVKGQFDHIYSCEMEIDRFESCAVDTDCDCPYKYDCNHLAGLIYYLEEHLDALIISFSSDGTATVEEEKLEEVVKEAKTKESIKQGKKQQKELLGEYKLAAQVLGESPFFLPQKEMVEDKAELAIIFALKKQIEMQLALRLPYRSKPLNIAAPKEFIQAVRYEEPIYLGNRRYFFTMNSFERESRKLFRLVMASARFIEVKGDRQSRTFHIDREAFGEILALSYDLAKQNQVDQGIVRTAEDGPEPLPCLYRCSIEEPLRFSSVPAQFRFAIDCLDTGVPKLLMRPHLHLEGQTVIEVEQATFFHCAKPGAIYENTYSRFHPKIRRAHLEKIQEIQEMTIPEPLFGTFIENSLEEILNYAEVSNQDILENYITLPYVEGVRGECDISYLDGELEASLSFVYGDTKIPSSHAKLKLDQIKTFVTDEGIMARNLTEEQKMLQDLFQDFVFHEGQALYISKNDRQIVEFMTEVVPRFQDRVQFNCPENLLERFVYDDTTFELSLKETSKVDRYEVDLKVDGHLQGITMEILWECLSAKKTYIELSAKKQLKKKTARDTVKINKILVLDLDLIAKLVQIFDEIGINSLDTHKEERPLWSLVSIDEEQFKDLPIKFKMTSKLKQIQQQMLGQTEFKPSPIPKQVDAKPRSYQIEGISWLERLREMHLSGILADDMGLGKTLQAIIALTQYHEMNKKALSLVVCPTTLVYNWQEEIAKFNPKFKVLPIEGTPTERKKLIETVSKHQVIITSYALLQKDIDMYKEIPFSYLILDEAQYIKNRTTRNAKSVKMLQAQHRLILTGTPIENALEELWSLFDFLMPGLLSSYERFTEKHVRKAGEDKSLALDTLRRKVSPFIMRRMKKDVLKDLPPVSNIVYHCHLSEAQKKLYRAYAASAREELTRLVKKEGFDRVQIHVLATLTRLKQICCHPAIFAKDQVEPGDSAKYDMLMELLRSLLDGNHKAVIFSQYTRMLQIVRDDLERMGVGFEYLDGASKNRMSIVKRFNEDPSIKIFLVSLKAGGSGLNLTGADTVIHYDLWWNPAVENQATDRVHRLGQNKAVSSYKLVTLDTIEEKIVELQNRKRELVEHVVSGDEEAMSKLTWEEVLELLQT